MKTTFIFILFVTFNVQMHAQTYTGSFDTLTVPNSGVFNGDTLPGALTGFADGNCYYSTFYDTSFGFGYWASGFALTNIVDTIDPSYNNLYGCAAGKGFNNSNNYVISTDKSTLKLQNLGSQLSKTLQGFSITNTFYAYSSMLNGDSFDTPFGDSTGARPDFFKLSIHAFLNGALKSDSIEFYLADFRFADNSQDYIIKNWSYVDCSTLGEVDSVQFHLISSRYNTFGYTTPLYFAMDEVIVKYSDNSSIAENGNELFSIYPNPTSDKLILKTTKQPMGFIADQTGKKVMNIESTMLDISALPQGLYHLYISHENNISHRSFIKN
jgi:hypothetical protein